MSGHSKWATIKRAKAAKDAKKGAIFTKLGNLITIAARDKGGDLDTNFSLRMAIDKAKQVNMPKDNIERAIKKGTGELNDGTQIEELYYEGIGPASTQYIIKSLTDNKNRSASTIRHAFTKWSGSLGTVMWNFAQMGVIRILSQNLENINLEELELELIEEEIEEFQNEEEGIIIYTSIANLEKTKKFLESKNIIVESAEIEYIAKEKIKLTEDDQEKIQKFEEHLDELEDVSDYYSNISD